MPELFGFNAFSPAEIAEEIEPVGVAADSIAWAGYFHNLLPVILGNLVGGSQKDKLCTIF